MFSEFMYTFRQFAPRLWGTPDGIVDRDEGAPDSASVRRRGVEGRSRALRAFTVAAAIAIASTNVSAVASTQSSDVWSYSAQLQNASALDESLVPANFWPAAISSVREMQSLAETDADDIEPLF